MCKKAILMGFAVALLFAVAGADKCLGSVNNDDCSIVDVDCLTSYNMVMQDWGEMQVVRVVFDIADDKIPLDEELIRPECPPDHHLMSLKFVRFLEGVTKGATETWANLKVEHKGNYAWQNEEIFLPITYAWFYEPTRFLGGWKKQFINNTVWQETPDGWIVKDILKNQVILQVEFKRAPYNGGLPPYLDRYMNGLLDMDPANATEPDHILKPADIWPTPQPYSALNPVIYDSRWIPIGGVQRVLETGTVKITWKKPPPGDYVYTPLDLRWMDLLPPSGSEFPGYYVHIIPDPGTVLQNFLHQSQGHGECHQ